MLCRCCIITILFASAALAKPQDGRPAPPNVLFIAIDDLNASVAPGGYGIFFSSGSGCACPPPIWSLIQERFRQLLTRDGRLRFDLKKRGQNPQIP